MEKARKFLLDFGMHIAKEEEGRIYFRGYGPDQYVYICEKSDKPEFRGGCFETESMEDLEAAQKKFGGEIRKLDGAPGGGYKLTIQDPDGFPFHLMYGQEPAETGQLPEKIVSNFPSEKDKPRKGTFLRFQPGPASVHKLGHFGLNVAHAIRKIANLIERVPGWNGDHNSLRAWRYFHSYVKNVRFRIFQ